MAKLIRLGNPQHTSDRVFFDRKELNQLLGLYTRRVISGQWRDYAIDQWRGAATFSVFLHAAGQPAFSITKSSAASNKGADYVLRWGPRKIKQAASIGEVLAVLDRRSGLALTTG